MSAVSSGGIMRTDVSRARGAAAAVVLGALLAACTGEAPDPTSEPGSGGTAGASDGASTDAPSASPRTPSPTPASPTPATPAPATPAPVAPPAPPAAPAAEPVTVVVAFGGWDGAGVEVGGYVDGHVESGGTCTLTLARDGSSVTSTAPGVPDATTTQCGLSVGGDRLSSGMWRATLSYSSPNASGSAPDVTIEVP